jgi:hypothetical protein
MNAVNFSHGDFIMLAMQAAFFAFTPLKLGPVLLIPGATALLFVLGVVVYLGLVRHVAKGPMPAQFLAGGSAIFLPPNRGNPAGKLAPGTAPLLAPTAGPTGGPRRECSSLGPTQPGCSR